MTGDSTNTVGETCEVEFASMAQESVLISVRGWDGDPEEGWLSASLRVRTQGFEAATNHVTFRIYDWKRFRQAIAELSTGESPSAASAFLEPWLELDLKSTGDTVELRGVLRGYLSGAVRVVFEFTLLKTSLSRILGQLDALTARYG